jgi:hypothetical protein
MFELAVVAASRGGMSLSVCWGYNDVTDLCAQLNDCAARVYAVHHFCPDGGEYVTAANGRSVACNVHGTADEPRQTAAPAAQSELGRLMQQFRDLTVSLTFLDDGLHAVVTLDRAGGKGEVGGGR